MLTKDEKLTSSREYGEKKAIESIWNHAIASANILHVISFCFLSKENENGKAFTMRFFFTSQGYLYFTYRIHSIGILQEKNNLDFYGAKKKGKESSSSKGFFVTIRQTILYFVLYSLRTWGEISTSGTNTSIIDWGTQYFVEYLFFFLTQIHWSNHCPG